jgi:hypothetical protein
MILNNIEIQDLQSRHSSQDKHIFLYIVVEGIILLHHSPAMIVHAKYMLLSYSLVGIIADVFV